MKVLETVTAKGSLKRMTTECNPECESGREKGHRVRAMKSKYSMGVS